MPTVAELFTDNTRLVGFVLKRLSHRRAVRRLGLDDAEQHGLIGLFFAAQRFDSTRGVRFSTFATHYVRGYILGAASRFDRQARPLADFDRDTPIELASSEVEVIDFLESDRIEAALRRLSPRSREVIRRRFRQDETLREAGNALGLSPERVRQIEGHALRGLRGALA